MNTEELQPPNKIEQTPSEINPPLISGPDGKIHPVKVWDEEKEMEGSKGKYKIKMRVCQF